MMVTTGGRGCCVSGASASPLRPSSMSDSATRFRLWPNSVTTSSAVSASMTWLMVAITPMRISALMTSAPRSAMRLASSCTVIVSGTTTSRTIFVGSWSACSWCARCFSRARRTEARLRIRSSSPWFRTRLTVSLPVVRRRGSSRRGTRVGLRASVLPRLGRSSSGSSSILTLPAAESAATLAAAALPARSAISRRLSSSALRLPSASRR